MKAEGLIQFATTSFLRGLTFRDNIIIVDECQNCSGRELNTIMTRVGEGCRVIFCGDFRQSDLNNYKDDRDFKNFMDIVHEMPSFASIEFHREDIVRSGLVREYIETMERLNIQF
jgi:phosphate starvation-inducible protein PhoH